MQLNKETRKKQQTCKAEGSSGMAKWDLYCWDLTRTTAWAEEGKDQHKPHNHRLSECQISVVSLRFALGSSFFFPLWTIGQEKARLARKAPPTCYDAIRAPPGESCRSRPQPRWQQSLCSLRQAGASCEQLHEACPAVYTGCLHWGRFLFNLMLGWQSSSEMSRWNFSQIERTIIFFSFWSHGTA